MRPSLVLALLTSAATACTTEVGDEPHSTWCIKSEQALQERLRDPDQTQVVLAVFTDSLGICQPCTAVVSDTTEESGYEAAIRVNESDFKGQYETSFGAVKDLNDIQRQLQNAGCRFEDGKFTP